MDYGLLLDSTGTKPYTVYILDYPSVDDARYLGIERDSPIYHGRPMTVIVHHHVLEAKPPRAPLPLLSLRAGESPPRLLMVL